PLSVRHWAVPFSREPGWICRTDAAGPNRQSGALTEPGLAGRLVNILLTRKLWPANTIWNCAASFPGCALWSSPPLFLFCNCEADRRCRCHFLPAVHGTISKVILLDSTIGPSQQPKRR